MLNIDCLLVMQVHVVGLCLPRYDRKTVKPKEISGTSDGTWLPLALPIGYALKRRMVMP